MGNQPSTCEMCGAPEHVGRRWFSERPHRLYCDGFRARLPFRKFYDHALRTGRGRSQHGEEFIDCVWTLEAAWKWTFPNIEYNDCLGRENCDFGCFSLASLNQFGESSKIVRWLRQHGLQTFVRNLASECNIGEQTLLTLLHCMSWGLCAFVALDATAASGGDADIPRFALVVRRSGLPWHPCMTCFINDEDENEEDERDVEVGLLHHWLAHPSCELQDWVDDCLGRSLCTVGATGRGAFLQEAWVCLTCSPGTPVYRRLRKKACVPMHCATCASICHRGHNLKKLRQPVAFSCSCSRSYAECRAWTADSLAVGSYFDYHVHSPFFLGEFFRQRTESQRIRLLWVRYLLLLSAGRAALAKDNARLEFACGIMLGIMSGGCARAEMVRHQLDVNALKYFGMPELVCEILRWV